MVALTTCQSPAPGGPYGGIEGRGPHYWVAPRRLLGVLRVVALTTCQSLAPGGLAATERPSQMVGIRKQAPKGLRRFGGRYKI